MKRINFYTIKMVKERAGLYEVDTRVISPDNANQIIRATLDLEHESVEHFGILALNAKNKVVGIHTLSIGLVDRGLAHPREVFKAALMNNAVSIVLFHNHPSEECTPSREDIEITKRIAECGELMDISVLDHIIIGGENYCSMKQMGLF